jgi:hypothetical protein
MRLLRRDLSQLTGKALDSLYDRHSFRRLSPLEAKGFNAKDAK